MGLRLSEICGLRWNDIDFENRVVRISRQVINKSKTEKNNMFHFESPKTRTSVREIVLGDMLASLLLKEKRRQEEAEREYGGILHDTASGWERPCGMKKTVKTRKP